MKKYILSIGLLISLSTSMHLRGDVDWGAVKQESAKTFFTKLIEGGVKIIIEVGETFIVNPLIILPLKAAFKMFPRQSELDSLVELSQKLRALGLSEWKVRGILRNRMNNCLHNINKK